MQGSIELMPPVCPVCDMAEGEAASPFVPQELICWNCWRWLVKFMLTKSAQLQYKLTALGAL